jgi:pimeloyl-ACP methyl ester carboxylesterase
MASETANPTTQYAESDGLSIAYQVFGSGTKDLVLIPGILTHLELNWEYPAYARMLRRLGQTFRVIMFDKRGQGLLTGSKAFRRWKSEWMTCATS